MSGNRSLPWISAAVVPAFLAGLSRKQCQSHCTEQLTVSCRVQSSSALPQLFCLTPVPTTVDYLSGDLPSVTTYRRWGGRVEVSFVPAGGVGLSSPWRRVAREPMSAPLLHCLHVFQCPGTICVFLGCSRGWDSRTWWLLLSNCCLQELGLRVERW